MVGLNDVLWSFIGSMINTATLNADVLGALQIIVDMFSVWFALWWLFWFLRLPLKIFKMSRGMLR